uniref:Uncharacterized protein n=1 Tax=Quercus lobata TaxID=97700 RepID=A0A7N2N8Y7_QUELO
MQRLTISGAGQICACSIEMAFETSTTKYLFDNYCYLYISMYHFPNRIISLLQFGVGHCIGKIWPPKLCPTMCSLQASIQKP